MSAVSLVPQSFSKVTRISRRVSREKWPCVCECRLDFRHTEYLDQHVTKSVGKSFQCANCLSSFATERKAALHLSGQGRCAKRSGGHKVNTVRYVLQKIPRFKLLTCLVPATGCYPWGHRTDSGSRNEHNEEQGPSCRQSKTPWSSLYAICS